MLFINTCPYTTYGGSRAGGAHRLTVNLWVQLMNLPLLLFMPLWIKASSKNST